MVVFSSSNMALMLNLVDVAINFLEFYFYVIQGLKRIMAVKIV